VDGLAVRFVVKEKELKLAALTPVDGRRERETPVSASRDKK
jgi:hypothetical protein